jgi:predicted acylesterase/phospholipase RssA
MEFINTNEQIHNEKISKYDTLVLSGASSKCILTLGGLQYMYDNFLLNQVNTYIGTSSGSIINFFLIIGYTPIEIMMYICTHQLMEKLQHFNVVAMLNGGGASSFSNIQEQLEKMTILKIGFLPTLQDLKNKFGKTFICVTYNITESKTEYISSETYPDLPCITALRMSSNLPFIFENFKYGNNFYIDGGISDNFSIDTGDNIGENVFGIVLSKNGNFKNEPHSNILEFIYKLMFIPINQSIDYKISKVSKKCHVVKLEYETIKFFEFNINSRDKLEMFSSGYQQMKKNIE